MGFRSPRLSTRTALGKTLGQVVPTYLWGWEWFRTHNLEEEQREAVWPVGPLPASGAMLDVGAAQWAKAGDQGDF